MMEVGLMESLSESWFVAIRVAKEVRNDLIMKRVGSRGYGVESSGSCRGSFWCLVHSEYVCIGQSRS